MKVFITEPIPQAGIDLLKKENFELEIWESEYSITEDELIEKCKNSDALLCTMNVKKLTTKFLNECSHLKVISLYSVGFDYVDIETATKNNIPISNTPDVLSNATADVAFILLLTASRKFFHLNRKILRGKWEGFRAMADLGLELDNKTLGIYGLGSIGFEMARKCVGAYNMNIIYHNRNRNEKAEKELGAKYVSFDELLTQSDVVSVHSVLSKETEGIFDKKAFTKMKKKSIFINVSRGLIHNEKDLAEALINGDIWGAGLDVTNPEPMDKNNPLLMMPNVSITPHIGSATEETRSNMAKMSAGNIIAGLKDEKLPNIVNVDVYNRK